MQKYNELQSQLKDLQRQQQQSPQKQKSNNLQGNSELSTTGDSKVQLQQHYNQEIEPKKLEMHSSSSDEDNKQKANTEQINQTEQQ